MAWIKNVAKLKTQTSVKYNACFFINSKVYANLNIIKIQ